MILDNGEHYIRAAEAKLWTSASGHGVPAIMFNGGSGCDDYLAPVARLIDILGMMQTSSLSSADRSVKTKLVTRSTTIKTYHQLHRIVVSRGNNG